MSLAHLPAETRRLIRTLKPYDVVEVTWEDAYIVIRDSTMEDAQKMAGNEQYIRRTLGFVVQADDDYITTAGTDDRHAVYSHSEAADFTVLCMGFVRDVELIRRDPRKKKS